MSESFYRGKLNSGAYEVGDVVGPNAYGEYLVCRATTETSAEFWTITPDDLKTAIERDEPRTVAEYELRRALVKKALGDSG